MGDDKEGWVLYPSPSGGGYVGAPLKRGASTSRRHPEPPAGLAEFEQHVMASDAPAVVLIDRELIRGLLRYVRQLERDVEEGSFW